MPVAKSRAGGGAVERNASRMSQESKLSSQQELKDQEGNAVYTCTGNFARDFMELCRQQLKLAVVPPVVLRPGMPHAQTSSLAGHSVVEEKEAHSSKGGKARGNALEKKQEQQRQSSVVQENYGTPLIDGDGCGCAEVPPKTFSIADNTLRYFKPCIQVTLDSSGNAATPVNPAAGDLENVNSSAVAEIYIRGWKVDVCMLDVLRQCFTTMNHLHILNLWRAGLNTKSVECLASVLPYCPSLTTLILDNNPIPCQPWYMLLCSTARNQLTHLSLRYNAVSDYGLALISNMLSNDDIFSSVPDLYPPPPTATATEQCMTLSVEGADQYAEPSTSDEWKKQGDCSLLSLDLTGNNITDVGIQYLATALRWNRTLQWLCLGSNQIGDCGAVILAEVLSRFRLTHQEIVARRKLLLPPSLFGAARPASSVSLTRQFDQRDKSNTIRYTNASTKGAKVSASTASSKVKKEVKGSKDDEKTKGKARDLSAEGRLPKKGSNSSLQQVGGTGAKKLGVSAKKKSGGGSSKSGDTASEDSVDMSPNDEEQDKVSAELESHPLLGPVEYVGNGVLLINGNLVLRSLSLFNNLIGDNGALAFLNAVKCQTTLLASTTTSSVNQQRQKSAGPARSTMDPGANTGLMHLNLQKNPNVNDEETLIELDRVLTLRDPTRASSVSRTDVTSDTKP